MTPTSLAPVVDHRAFVALRLLRSVAETTVPVEAPLSPIEDEGIDEAAHFLRCPVCAAGWLR